MHAHDRAEALLRQFLATIAGKLHVFDARMDLGEFPRLRIGINDLFDSTGKFQFE